MRVVRIAACRCGVARMDFALRRLSGFLFQEEVVSSHFLLVVELTVQLVDSGSVRIRITTEGDVQVLQELVASSQ